jgi:hypothetical protein
LLDAHQIRHTFVTIPAATRGTCGEEIFAISFRCCSDSFRYNQVNDDGDEDNPESLTLSPRQRHVSRS